MKPIAPDDRASTAGRAFSWSTISSIRARRREIVRELLPKAHFATVYAKPLGRPLVDTFVTEVSQDTWIYFPWDLGLAFQAPIATQGK